MQPAKKQRPGQPTRRGSAADILRRRDLDEDYFSYEWILLYATFVVTGLIFLLFTPYTHQLDEIKVSMLASFPPFLLIIALFKVDFGGMRWKTHASTFLLGFYVVSMIISYLINPYKPIAERVVWFQVSCSTFTVIYAWFMNSENKMRKVMAYFVLLSLASVIIGLFLFAGQGFTDAIAQSMKRSDYWSPQARNLVATLAQAKQMYSTILNEDFYAAYLIMMIPMTLSMFFVEDHLNFKILAIATFLLMNVCLFFTNSNDSFMAITLIVYPVYFVLGVLYVKTWNLSKRMLITFFACSAVLGITVFVLMIPQLSQTWAFKAAALEGRKVLWSGGFWPWIYGHDLTRQHPDLLAIVFGTGPGGYRFYFPLFRRPDFFDQQINNVTLFSHNYYIDILCETGALGLGFFLAFCGRVFYDAVQQIRFTANRSHRFYQMACISGLAGVFLQNFFSPNNRWAVDGMIFWGLFGLSMGLHHLDNPASESRPVERQALNRPLIAKAALGMLALFFLLRSVPQGIEYFSAAVANGKGLVYMEVADGYSGSEKRGLLELSEKYFIETLKTNPTFVTAYYKLAHVQNQLGKVDDAIKTYETLDSYCPHYSEIHLNLGIMYSVRSELQTGEKRRESLEKAYTEIKEGARQELKPNVQAIASMIGKALAQFYEQTAAERPSPESKEFKTPDGAANGHEKAMKVYEELKGYNRNIIQYHPSLEEYKQERTKHYEMAQQELIRLAEITGKLSEAEQVLATMYREHPDDSAYLNKLMSFYDKQGKVKEKTTFLEGAVKDDPMDVRLRRLLADGYNQTGDEDRYRNELKKIEVLSPGDKTALTGLYLCYRKDGKEDKASEYKQKLQAMGVDVDKLSTAPALAKETSSSAQLLKKIESAEFVAERTGDTGATQPSVAPPTENTTPGSVQPESQSVTGSTASAATAATTAVPAAR